MDKQLELEFLDYIDNLNAIDIFYLIVEAFLVNHNVEDQELPAEVLEAYNKMVSSADCKFNTSLVRKAIEKQQ